MPEREEKAGRGGANICPYKPNAKVSYLFKCTRDCKGKIEGKMETKWLSSLNVSKQRPLVQPAASA